MEFTLRNQFIVICLLVAFVLTSAPVASVDIASIHGYPLPLSVRISPSVTSVEVVSNYGHASAAFAGIGVGSSASAADVAMITSVKEPVPSGTGSYWATVDLSPCPAFGTCYVSVGILDGSASILLLDSDSESFERGCAALSESCVINSDCCQEADGAVCGASWCSCYWPSATEQGGTCITSCDEYFGPSEKDCAVGAFSDWDGSGSTWNGGGFWCSYNHCCLEPLVWDPDVSNCVDDRAELDIISTPPVGGYAAACDPVIFDVKYATPHGTCQLDYDGATNTNACSTLDLFNSQHVYATSGTKYPKITSFDLSTTWDSDPSEIVIEAEPFVQCAAVSPDEICDGESVTIKVVSGEPSTSRNCVLTASGPGGTLTTSDTCGAIDGHTFTFNNPGTYTVTVEDTTSSAVCPGHSGVSSTCPQVIEVRDCNVYCDAFDTSRVAANEVFNIPSVFTEPSYPFSVDDCYIEEYEGGTTTEIWRGKCSGMSNPTTHSVNACGDYEYSINNNAPPPQFGDREVFCGVKPVGFCDVAHCTDPLSAPPVAPNVVFEEASCGHPPIGGLSPEQNAAGLEWGWTSVPCLDDCDCYCRETPVCGNGRLQWPEEVCDGGIYQGDYTCTSEVGAISYVVGDDQYWIPPGAGLNYIAQNGAENYLGYDQGALSCEDGCQEANAFGCSCNHPRRHRIDSGSNPRCEYKVDQCNIANCESFLGITDVVDAQKTGGSMASTPSTEWIHAYNSDAINDYLGTGSQSTCYCAQCKPGYFWDGGACVWHSVCGDSQIQQPNDDGEIEACDPGGVTGGPFGTGVDLGTASCNDGGWDLGSVTCLADCSVDYSLCTCDNEFEIHDGNTCVLQPQSIDSLVFLAPFADPVVVNAATYMYTSQVSWSNSRLTQLRMEFVTPSGITIACPSTASSSDTDGTQSLSCGTDAFEYGSWTVRAHATINNGLYGLTATPPLEATFFAGCPATEPHWTGSACVECINDGHCSGGWLCQADVCVEPPTMQVTLNNVPAVVIPGSEHTFYANFDWSGGAGNTVLQEITYQRPDGSTGTCGTWTSSSPANNMDQYCTLTFDQTVGWTITARGEILGTGEFDTAEAWPEAKCDPGFELFAGSCASCDVPSTACVGDFVSFNTDYQNGLAPPGTCYYDHGTFQSPALFCSNMDQVYSYSEPNTYGITLNQGGDSLSCGSVVVDCCGGLVWDGTQCRTAITPPSASINSLTPSSSVDTGTAMTTQVTVNDELDNIDYTLDWQGDGVPDRVENTGGSTSETASYGFTAPASPGSYVLTLRVTDSDGETATDTWNYAVNCPAGLINNGGVCVECVVNADCGGGDICSGNICIPPTCGDGVEQGGETCDDGNTVSGDGCSNTCQDEANCNNDGGCDGIEVCDLCAYDCGTCGYVCGNGIQEGTEECDDGNTGNGDGCSSTCTHELNCNNDGTCNGAETCLTCLNDCGICICGDGTIQGGEECDDGNTQNGDGCSSSCLNEAPCNNINGCEAGESCSVCMQDCGACVCGNGNLDPGEDCDDGNVNNGDGCSASCQHEVGCNNDLNCDAPGEQCGLCAYDCGPCVCGNGNLDPGEQCDDGGLVSGDGCSNTCQHESPCDNDLICDSGSGEDANNCAWDCSACTTGPDVCGDGTCSVTETCSSCEEDCGLCTDTIGSCGNGVCNRRESCCSCPADCGLCSGDHCGDVTCQGFEDPTQCARDCSGTPPLPTCDDGAGTCDAGESCLNCWQDCGLCPPEIDDDIDNDGDGDIDFCDSDLPCNPPNVQVGCLDCNPPSGCSVPDCQALNPAYEFSACVSSYVVGLDPVWEDRSADLACTSPLFCVCGYCPVGTSYDGAAYKCAESDCGNGLDDDGDGTIDLLDADCSFADGDPVIDFFTVTLNPASGLRPVDITYEYQIQDEVGVTYIMETGFGGFPVVATGGPFVNDVTVRNGVLDTGTFTARLTVIDQPNGNTVSVTRTFTIWSEDGDQDGVPVPDPASCSDLSCYWNGECYTPFDTSGGRVCPESSIMCVVEGGFGVIRERDESSIYETGGATCPSGTYVDDGWCEGGQARCDTSPIPGVPGTPDRSFLCGDDPDETYFEYRRYRDYFDTVGTLHKACLQGVGPNSCYGKDAGLNDRHYTNGQEVCVLEGDDNDCDGYLPIYDELSCWWQVTGTVTITSSEGFPYAGYLSEIENEPVDVFPTGFRNDKADDTGYYEFVNPILVPYVIDDLTATFAGALSITEDTGMFASDPPGAIVVDFAMEELECNADCTNNFGLCDTGCIGKNGCFPGGLISADELEVFEACAPPNTAFAKRPGDTVELDVVGADRRYGNCCSGPINTVPAPDADLDTGDIENLIKFTRVVTVDGQPARLVIATWDDPEE